MRYRRRGVARARSGVVISAESAAGSPWPLPAGPWRERWDALGRADLIVVTRKTATAAVAGALADRLRRNEHAALCTAFLSISHLEGVQSGTRHPIEAVTGRRIVAAAGIADPEEIG